MRVRYFTLDGKHVHTVSEDGTILCSIHDSSRDVPLSVVCECCGGIKPQWIRVTTRMMREARGKYMACSLCEFVRSSSEAAMHSLTGGMNAFKA